MCFSDRELTRLYGTGTPNERRRHIFSLVCIRIYGRIVRSCPIYITRGGTKKRFEPARDSGPESRLPPTFRFRVSFGETASRVMWCALRGTRIYDSRAMTVFTNCLQILLLLTILFTSVACGKCTIVLINTIFNYFLAASGIALCR